MGSLTFSLRPVPPFRLDLTAWVLRRRVNNSIDRWDGTTWRRVLVFRDKPVEVQVTQTSPADTPRLQVAVIGARLAQDIRPKVTATLERVLGLRLDLSEFYRFSSRDRKLRTLTQPFRGFKPPRFPSVFEAAINAIACQQLSLTLGVHLLNRLAEHYGLAFEGPNGRAYSIARPEALAEARPDALRRLGFSRQKARALIELSQAVAGGDFDPESIVELDDKAALSRLLKLRGIGRWSAEYVLLRGLGRVHIFPGDDVGARNHLQSWLGVEEPLDYDGVRRVLGRWDRYGGLVYFHMLLTGLAEAGYLS
jgi:DNA-3-methyladenine glycosylase II